MSNASTIGSRKHSVFPDPVPVATTSAVFPALNALGHFFRPAIAPVWLNICQISAVFIGLAFFTTPVLALGVGVIVAGVLQVWLQLKPLRERGFAPKLVWAPGNPAIRRLGWILLPSVLGASAYQLNTITTRAIASFFGDGPVSYLYYATRLLELPLGVFIFALSMASLPSLARSFLPSSWSYYTPTRWDVGLFVGTLGLFFTLFLLFFRYVPVIAMSEVKGAMPEAHAGHHKAHGKEH